MTDTVAGTAGASTPAPPRAIELHMRGGRHADAAARARARAPVPPPRPERPLRRPDGIEQASLLQAAEYVLAAYATDGWPLPPDRRAREVNSQQRRRGDELLASAELASPMTRVDLYDQRAPKGKSPHRLTATGIAWREEVAASAARAATGVTPWLCEWPLRGIDDIPEPGKRRGVVYGTEWIGGQHEVVANHAPTPRGGTGADAGSRAIERLLRDSGVYRTADNDPPPFIPAVAVSVENAIDLPWERTFPIAERPFVPNMVWLANGDVVPSRHLIAICKRHGRQCVERLRWTPTRQGEVPGYVVTMDELVDKGVRTPLAIVVVVKDDAVRHWRDEHRAAGTWLHETVGID